MRRIQPISLEEELAGLEMSGALSLSLWFYAASRRKAYNFMQSLLEAEFVSVKPAQLLMSVELLRPIDQDRRLTIVAKTGSQKVPLCYLKFFHDELALFARRYGCFFGGSDLEGEPTEVELQAYRSLARQFCFGQSVTVH